jgi:tRNA threonylcarbamoyl adenosine modification protein YjeE
VIFAASRHLFVVLKGHRTIIATPDGHIFINPTGNPGMATGGTGDVLTGMIAAWLAQLLDAEAACRLAVFLHGAAGDLAEKEEGQVSMTAADLVARIGDALNRLTNPERTRSGRASRMPAYVTRSEDETQRIAASLAAVLQVGGVVLLSGTLGAGKTLFVRGLAAGLGLDPAEVSSPTFTLVHEYRGGRLPLYHADLYRLDSAAAEELGLEELGAADGILAIEWPERLDREIPGATRVTIEVVDAGTRRIKW